MAKNGVTPAMSIFVFVTGCPSLIPETDPCVDARMGKKVMCRTCDLYGTGFILTDDGKVVRAYSTFATYGTL